MQEQLQDWGTDADKMTTEIGNTHGLSTLEDNQVQLKVIINQNGWKNKQRQEGNGA